MVITKPELQTCLAALSAVLLNPCLTLAQPITEEVPEEVLRTEIITAARSPLTGEPLSAADYAALEEQLGTAQSLPNVDPRLENLLLLMKLRHLAQSLFPLGL